jgi:outer membrane biosynthesis protein TonB
VVDVDPRGRVVQAKLDAPGPSRYFARLSMAAAPDWKFTPPRVNGQIVPSEWVINFGYSEADTSASATERHP